MFDWSIDYNDPRGWGVGVGGRAPVGGGGWGNQNYPYNPNFPVYPRQDNQFLLIGLIVLGAVVLLRK